VKIRAESRYGDSINDRTGMILPANSDGFFPLTSHLDDSIPISISDLNYTQFLSNHIGLTIGKFDTLDGDPNEFAGGRGVSQFMNSHFLLSAPLALLVPYSTLGLVDLQNGQSDHQGIGMFARMAFADDDTNLAEFSISVGLGGRGIIRGRDDDTFGIGYFYTKIQDTRIGGIIGLDDSSQGGEVFYNLAITTASHLTFDIQILPERGDHAPSEV